VPHRDNIEKTTVPSHRKNKTELCASHKTSDASMEKKPAAQNARYTSLPDFSTGGGRYQQENETAERGGSGRGGSYKRVKVRGLVYSKKDEEREGSP